VSPLFDWFRNDDGTPAVDAGPELKAELRRIANLFLLSSVTLILFLLRAFSVALHVDFFPDAVIVVWGVVMLIGWAATLVYAAWVTLKARRWGWFVACVIPVTCVPVAVAYAWVRRQEIERDVLGPEDPSSSRQRRGGRGRRR
jgi:hypothetical protein